MRSLDILRGFALLGMILVHVHQHLEEPATGLEDLISSPVAIRRGSGVAAAGLLRAVPPSQ